MAVQIHSIKMGHLPSVLISGRWGGATIISGPCACGRGDQIPLGIKVSGRVENGILIITLALAGMRLDFTFTEFVARDVEESPCGG